MGVLVFLAGRCCFGCWCWGHDLVMVDLVVVLGCVDIVAPVAVEVVVLIVVVVVVVIKRNGSSSCKSRTRNSSNRRSKNE